MQITLSSTCLLPILPGLRALQFGEGLNTLLSALKAEQARLSEQHGRYVPLLLKIAPDLSNKECQDIALALLLHNMDGVIATNTTISRTGLDGSALASESGGLSGAPMAKKSGHRKNIKPEFKKFHTHYRRGWNKGLCQCSRKI